MVYSPLIHLHPVVKLDDQISSIMMKLVNLITLKLCWLNSFTFKLVEQLRISQIEKVR